MKFSTLLYIALIPSLTGCTAFNEMLGIAEKTTLEELEKDAIFITSGQVVTIPAPVAVATPISEPSLTAK